MPLVAPPLNLPTSSHIVDVSAIKAARIVTSSSIFFDDHIKGLDVLDMPVFSFLIESANKQQRIIFDLGVKKDWESLPSGSE